jgi:hypothetical protein
LIALHSSFQPDMYPIYISIVPRQKHCFLLYNDYTTYHLRSIMAIAPLQAALPAALVGIP